MKLIARKAAEAALRAWFAVNRSAFKQPASGGRPRLFVDISVIMRHDAATGIQRVVRAIWLALAASRSPKFELVPVYAGRTHGYVHADPRFLEGAKPAGRIPVGARPGDKFLALDLAAHYLPNCTEQLQAWRDAGATTHFVVYDLLPLDNPEWFNPASVEHFSRWFQVLLKHADQALCISDDVQSKLRERLGRSGRTDSPEIGRLHLSGDIANSRPSSGMDARTTALLQRMRQRPAILMVGTIEPRKGHDAALAAFEYLWAQPGGGPDLVIAGKPGWRTDVLQQRLRRHPEAGQRLHWIEDASDEALAALYTACRGVLFTSRGEGFGLPLAEAAMHGCWALTRDLPVFREQPLANLLFFEDEQPGALGMRILELLGKAQAGPPEPSDLPGWDWCADKLLEEISSCARPTDAAPAPIHASL